MSETCRYCKYFAGLGESEGTKPEFDPDWEIGHCSRYPPIFPPAGKISTLSDECHDNPKVMSYFLCGEFKSRTGEL